MKNQRKVAVAIDGPSGAGKSTLSRALAKELGFVYVDTGALYRAIGYYVITRGEKPDNIAVVEELLSGLTVELKFAAGEQRVFIGGADVTGLIRTPEVSLAASAVSAIPAVRAFLFDTQQEIARRENVIMDGRDIGTVVLPGADVKIFLTASAEERARRRHEELLQKGISESYERVLADMIKRDSDDAGRDAAPLRQAEDAALADTTGLSFEQSLALLRKMVSDKITGKEPLSI